MFTRKLILFLIAALLFAAVAISTASADSQSVQFDQVFHGETGNIDLWTFSAVCDECFDDNIDFDSGYSGLGTSIGVDGNVTWNAVNSNSLNYSPELVRQGSTLDTLTLTNAIPGSVTVNYHLYGKWGLFNDADGDGPGAWNPTTFTSGVDTWLTSTIPCALPLQAGQHVCEKEEDFGMGTIHTPFAQFTMTLHIKTVVTMDTTGIVGVRTAVVDAGQPIPDAAVSYTPLGVGGLGTFADPFFISCLQPEGEMLTYSLKDMHLDASYIETDHILSILFAVKDPTGIDTWSSVSTGGISFFDPYFADGMHVTTDDVSFQLGEIAPDVTPPTIEPLGFFLGLEGAAIQLHADAYDNCGAPTLRWDFSDGGVAFGPNPQHTFADGGVYTGLLTATDVTGLTTMVNFEVHVVNAKPVANAGPDALEAWGVQVPFNGQAVDPGSADQGTLSYEWDFGDNSPKGHAEDVMHAYGAPGTYIATLKVCDKDGACDTDTREVTIRKRNTSTSYLGPQMWTYDTQVFLSASLVDEFGQPVNGRAIGFHVDGAWIGGANTNSLGLADRSHQVTQTAGGHNVIAAFGGDSLYEQSGSFGGSVVVVKATTVTYMGPLSGAPNKVITLSAVLKDSEGKPLAGRTVNFQVGTQSASAVTDANGIAQTTLKLTQKQGSYSMTTTWTPTGADVTKYAGSSDIDAFKLAAK